MRIQLHLAIDEEGKRLIAEASSFLKINMSSFIVMSAVDKARKVINEKESLKLIINN